MNVPIIQLSIESMKHTLHTALTEHAALMDTSIQQAVEEYCTPENIDSVVKKAAMQALDIAVKEEIRNFFGFGRAGRAAVREAVVAWLDEAYPVPDKGETK